ncbi:2-deoxy-D-gluconate 3-dehydrogenase [Halolactibacillus halophilus]|uniref:2-deoxy-D-gluconate 3-dehydrogenase n=1 Tax=Halolactibacillus halophilus TaxID=306540 RepID=A0A1I5MEU9_9BACI|nr:2-dehydro-3-deoxy-D-gluconate 5-dehydrogenase KduD [Halolactibacillus halophilus]GEM02213.1 2-deoxy-D-gluconate 3-dehydrogenase [Halolactibacillus halophilus]SFP08114.1 2-deoxy-D-gluconate 3-dehydrogenase [Halolactibacillus halophilus]
MGNTYIKEMFSLEGKVALVTGGNSGIGLGIANGLAKAGADIFIVTHSGRNTEEVRAEIEGIGRKVEFFQADLSIEENTTKSIEKCIEAFGQIDILVNNAGSIYRESLLEGTNEGWKNIIDLNLSALYYISKEASKHMVKQGHGKIINIASMLSFQGGKFVPSYTASKHGVAGVTKAFANELAEKNIQINAIAPGYIKTANTKPIRDDAKRSAEILGRIPANRWGEPSDIAGAAVFLSSKASDYMNGHILAVDGGWLIR